MSWNVLNANFCKRNEVAQMIKATLTGIALKIHILFFLQNKAVKALVYLDLSGRF